MSQPVTVILPAHNGADYLAESISSVLAQTHREFELHVLDDHSTDASPAIAQEFAARDPRVRYSRNPEWFGLFKTLNRGCREARTEWVRIWAQDDVMHPDCLERMVAAAAGWSTAGMVYCNFREIDAAGRPTGHEAVYDPLRQRTPELAGPSLSALLFFVYGCLPGNISTVLLRRAAWEALGGFTEGNQQAPDYDMWVQVSERYDVGFVRERLIDLREHSLQLSRLGQKQLTTIAEERPVIDRLRRRLIGVLSTDEFDRYWRHHRGRQHVHWVARAAARGELGLVARGWREIARYGQPLGQALTWLRTANGRVGTIDPHRFFDRAAGRLAGARPAEAMR